MLSLSSLPFDPEQTWAIGAAIDRHQERNVG
jgi:hypothetical protein